MFGDQNRARSLHRPTERCLCSTAHADPGGSTDELFASWAELLTAGGGVGRFLGSTGAGTDGTLSGGDKPNCLCRRARGEGARIEPNRPIRRVVIRITQNAGEPF